MSTNRALGGPRSRACAKSVRDEDGGREAKICAHGQPGARVDTPIPRRVQREGVRRCDAR
eukprot:4963646-Pleurochrysis_carterae.AAC.1